MSNRPPTISNSFKSRQIDVTEKLNVTGVILSGGVNLFNLLSATGSALLSGIQTLSYNEPQALLTITEGNSVSLSSIVVYTNTLVQQTSSAVPTVLQGYLATNNVNISGVSTNVIAASSSNIPVTVVDVSASTTFTNNDTNKVYHFNTTSNSLCAIIPNSLSNGFNVAIMNVGTNNLQISAANLNSVGTTIIDQFGGAYIYKQNNTIFAVGRLF